MYEGKVIIRYLPELILDKENGKNWVVHTYRSDKTTPVFRYKENGEWKNPVECLNKICWTVMKGEKDKKGCKRLYIYLYHNTEIATDIMPDMELWIYMVGGKWTGAGSRASWEFKGQVLYKERFYSITGNHWEDFVIVKDCTELTQLKKTATRNHHNFRTTIYSPTFEQLDYIWQKGW